ncbi:MAG: Verru_Chthon cassette protein D [Chthoniobacter sp.]|nr:Verru_Chthon cassette protein D [Chthoniobacter sp.]
MKKSSVTNLRAAFSLLELLVVILIIAIIARFTVPAVTGIIRGSAITQSSQMLTDQFSLARQQALSRNRAIEVRIYQYADPEVPGEAVATATTWQYRAFQMFEVVESGVAVPLAKMERLAGSVIINPSVTFSTIIAGTGQTAKVPVATKDPSLPRGVGNNYKYVSFRFLPDGSTSLSPTYSAGWFLTIHNASDKAAGSVPPANFFTLQLDPVSGSSKSFRPTAG